jgi:hypothetical protein
MKIKSASSSTPKGLRITAQGCEPRATLGKPAAIPSNPVWVAQVGHSYAFVREGNDWNGCEVSVLAIKGKKLIVARCCNVCDALLSPKGSPKRKFKTWSCTSDELC